MANLAIVERPSVLSFDRDSFEETCGDLMRAVCHDRAPDVLIGIPTGGRHVARAMAKATGFTTPILEMTCRRPSSKLKPGSGAIKRTIAKLPRPALDRLRVIEHAILTRMSGSPPSTPYRFEQRELDAIERWAAGAGRRPTILVVDDAVDSGATLSQVLERVRHLAPRNATILSAAITVTTARPRAMPDYSLFHRQLCRFPWALDAG